MRGHTSSLSFNFCKSLMIVSRNYRIGTHYPSHIRRIRYMHLRWRSCGGLSDEVKVFFSNFIISVLSLPWLLVQSSFCFKCFGCWFEDHRPATCRQMSVWGEAVSLGSEAAKAKGTDQSFLDYMYIYRNTVKCPGLRILFAFWTAVAECFAFLQFISVLPLVIILLLLLLLLLLLFSFLLLLSSVYCFNWVAGACHWFLLLHSTIYSLWK